ncbi:QCR9 protein, partial [Sterrhoptilus dennistouni]|nr:QCR9 protein [Sterrhoptilus dennistouni]
MALLRQGYGSLFRRTSTFALSVVLGAVLFERVFDQGGDMLFEQLNEGKLWKHIKHKYEN